MNILETIDEFGELHFPEIFSVVTVDCVRKRSLEMTEDGKLVDYNAPSKKRKYMKITE